MKTIQQAEKEARKIVNNWVLGAALTGWIPGSTLFLGAGDVIMIRQVADAFGIGFINEDAIRAHFTGVFGSILGGIVATEALNFIPFIGQVVKAGILAIAKNKIGDYVINYFKERSPLA